VLGRLSRLSKNFRLALQAENLEVRPGAYRDEIQRFERTHAVRLPVDMRRFYASIDGMADLDWGFESDIRVLPIAEIVPVREAFPDSSTPSRPADAFVIADNSISACFFAIDLRGPGNPVFLVAEEPIRVATGFADFLRKVLSDSPALFHGEHAA
jgi:hypothetical protein